MQFDDARFVACFTRTCRDADLGGQVVEKSADLLDMAVADQAVALGRRGLTEPWRQRFASQCAAFPEIPCFGDPPASASDLVIRSRSASA